MANKLKIGITGGIASGKSEVCKYLESKKFVVIYADKISKEILVKDETAIDEIKQIFGEAAYKNNQPDHAYLAEKVFSSPKNVKLINAILHPRVAVKSEEMMNSVLKNRSVVFYEAALIFEAMIEKRFDKILLITSEINLRKRRALSSGNFDEITFNERVKNQISDEEKIKMSDYIIRNDGTKEELFLQVDDFLKRAGIE